MYFENKEALIKMIILVLQGRVVWTWIGSVKKSIWIRSFVKYFHTSQQVADFF